MVRMEPYPVQLVQALSQKKIHRKEKTLMTLLMNTKIEEAWKLIRELNAAKSDITVQLMVKEGCCWEKKLELQRLTRRNRDSPSFVDWRKNELDYLQKRLKILYDVYNSREKKLSTLCSSEKQLNDHIWKLHHQIQHKRKNLLEEKQLLQEMKLLESTRKEVRSNEEKYLHSKEAIEDQIKLVRVDIDGAGRHRHISGAGRHQLGIGRPIKHLEREVETTEKDITFLKERLGEINRVKGVVYRTILEQKEQREELM